MVMRTEVKRKREIQDNAQTACFYASEDAVFRYINKKGGDSFALGCVWME